MFVFVIDTSFMNVSISAVVHDLDTTVSGVQAAVAIEALVSAAFILISKLGDLFGRKRAYVVGLVFYALGALAMVFAQGLTAIIVFWAVIGGLGASLYLPAMQSLIHGNFGEGAGEGLRAGRGVGRDRGRDRAADRRLLTTVVSWRAGFLLEALIITAVLVGSRRIRDVPYTGDRSVDSVGAFLSVIGMGGLVVGVLVWQEGSEYVAALLAIGVVAMAALVYWLVRRKRAEADLAGRRCLRPALQLRRHADLPPAGRSGCTADRAPDLSAAGLGLQRARGGCDARTTVAHDVRRGPARGEANRQTPGEQRHPGRVRAARRIDRDPHPARSEG